MSRNGLTYLEYLVIVGIVGIIVAFLIPFISLSTKPSAQQQSAIKFEKVEGALTASYDMSTVETLGNHSWMPLYIGTDTSKRYPLPSEYRLFILSALLAFEKEHPELEVTNWKIERDQGNSMPDTGSPKIYGLWIDHRPREQK